MTTEPLISLILSQASTGAGMLGLSLVVLLLCWASRGADAGDWRFDRPYGDDHG